MPAHPRGLTAAGPPPGARMGFFAPMSAPLSFDYVVVGAGSAGAVLAARLSEDAQVSVAVIEAGPPDTSPLIRVPLGVMVLAKDRRHNWLFQSEPQPGLGGRQVSVPRGRVLGGSSAINGMIYIRGHRADYDGWAALGCTGWDYDAVLPYFRRSERNLDPRLDDALHGRDGPLTVGYVPDPSPLGADFTAAAERLQLRLCPDFNAAEPEGVGLYQVTQTAGQRQSAAAAFLAPARARPNLHVLTGVQVDRIDLAQGRAQAVVGRRADGSAVRIAAAAEVVLAAGTIGSADLLLRSGIGPGAAVAAAGVAPVADLPGVGQNLQDHVDCLVICRSRSAASYGVSLRALPWRAWDVVNWVTRNRGMFASNLVESGGFVRSSPSEDRPDLQFHLIPAKKSHRGRIAEWGHGVSLHTCVLRPKSRGSVRRTGPDGPPRIDLGLLSHDDDLDRLVRGVVLAREILRQPPLARHGLSEVMPGAQVAGADALRAFVRAQARTVYHPVGTCAMGTGPDAVVDPSLRVRGVAALRVADASIMPRIVSGNTSAPAIMIAEKAADLIRSARADARIVPRPRAAAQ